MKDMYLRNLSTLKLDPVACTSCGMCLDVCPRDVLTMGEASVVIQDLDACMECGACAMNCSQQALSVRAGVGCAYAILTAGKSDCSCVNEAKRSR